MVSTIDLNAIDECLLTYLSAEQSAIVTGGKYLRLYRIEAVEVGADLGSADDTYITIESRKIWGSKTMNTGDSRRIATGDRSFEGTLSISVFDDDWGFDDFCGNFVVQDVTDGVQVAQVSGSGSTYNIVYQVS